MVKVLLVLHAGTYDNPLWPQEVKKNRGGHLPPPSRRGRQGVDEEVARAVGARSVKPKCQNFQIA